jgi:hypothetical protein
LFLVSEVLPFASKRFFANYELEHVMLAVSRSLPTTVNPYPNCSLNQKEAGMERHSFVWYGLLWAMLIFLCTTGNGCGAEAISGKQPYIVHADITAEGGFLATLPNGITFTDPKVFMDEAPAHLQQARASGQDVQVELGPKVSVEIAGANSTQQFNNQSTAKSGDVGQRQSALIYKEVGSVVITGGWDTGYVSGCIKQNAYKYAFRGNDKYTGKQYFDLHLAFWRQGLNLCVGLYESVYKLINKCSCDPDEKNKIYQEMYDLVRQTKINSAAANLVAVVLTTMVTAILVAI